MIGTRTLEKLMAADLFIFGTMVIVEVVWPTGHVDAYGMSFYMTHVRTFIPLATGFGIAVALLFRAASDLPPTGATLMVRRSLQAMAVLLIGILITPYTWGTFFNWAHMTLAAMLFVIQISLSFWLVEWHVSTIFNWFVLTIEAASGFVAMISLPDFGINLLFLGEIGFQLTFSALLLYSLSRLVPEGGSSGGLPVELDEREHARHRSRHQR